MDRTQTIAHAVSMMFDPSVSGAELVTYNGSNIYAHVEYGQDAAGAMTAGRMAQLIVLRSDVPLPTYRDEVVIDGLVWRVHRDDRHSVIVSADEISWTVKISTDERARISRP